MEYDWWARRTGATDVPGPDGAPSGHERGHERVLGRRDCARGAGLAPAADRTRRRAVFRLRFDGRGGYRRKVFLPLAAAGLAGATALLHSDFRHSQLWVMLPVYAATLCVACMVCHGERVRRKPSPRHLTALST